jgi:alpha-glucosidase
MSFNDPIEWWRHAVTYQVYVRSFADGDGDGIGDLPGITARLPYLRDLGVDALWITPFYTSPQNDHGYDVADYCDVDPLFGDLAAADALLDRAHELGLKVIVDLVPNHTSDQHEWFPAALAAAPGSPERERYLFRAGRGVDGELPPNNWVSVFGGPAWTRVPDGEWYLHLFDSTQPDLNWRNPEVGDMFEDVLTFWLDRGVDGFRVDVAHGLYKEESLRDQVVADGEQVASAAATTGGSMVERVERDEPMWDQPEVHDVYRRWHEILEKYDGDRMSVAEAWTQSPESMARFVRPDEMSQSFNFAWLLADWSAESFTEVITGTFAALAPVGATPTWVLSNHDVVRHATRYGGGAQGLARAKASTLTMLALPGSSYLYQGEELGLAEVAEIPSSERQDPTFFRNAGVEVGRDGCRVPLPWVADAPSFGFGPTAASHLPQPAWFAKYAVDVQAADPSSTLSMYRRALALRHELQGTEKLAWVSVDEPSVLAYQRPGGWTVVTNFGDAAAPLPAALADREVVLASGPLGDAAVLPAETTLWYR